MSKQPTTIVLQTNATPCYQYINISIHEWMSKQPTTIVLQTNATHVINTSIYQYMSG